MSRFTKQLRISEIFSEKILLLLVTSSKPNELSEDNYDFTEVDAKLLEFYHYCDTLPVGVLTEVAARIRKLAKDVEYLARDKAMDEMANSEDHISKALAMNCIRRFERSSTIGTEQC